MKINCRQGGTVHLASFLLVLVFCVLFAGGVEAQVTVTIDPSTTYQTIDGFGAHGARIPWWDAGPFYDTAFLDLMIDDLGINIERNEFYPLPEQPKEWPKQAPFLRALRDKAAASGEPLQFMATLWTPPQSMKSNHKDVMGNLLPSQYTAFGNYLVDKCYQYYADSGVSLSYISPQNEPTVDVTYNSCAYTPATYNDMIKVVGPIIHSRIPGVKIVAAEDSSVWKEAKTVNSFGQPIIDGGGGAEVDIWALHDYEDHSSDYLQKWQGAQARYVAGQHKHLWQTEDSGVFGVKDYSKNFYLAYHIAYALLYGNCSAWLWWQLGDDWVSQYGLMYKGAPIDQRYYIFKQFSRFVRPGAVMVKASHDQGDKLLVVPFKRNTSSGDNWAIVLVNNTDKPYNIHLAGKGLPSSFTVYQTTSKLSCANLGTVTDSLSLPGTSITTLVSGSFKGNGGAHEKE